MPVSFLKRTGTTRSAIPVIKPILIPFAGLRTRKYIVVVVARALFQIPPIRRT
ncbi:hypothetical protein [Treponema endosymbiont of Eucomonympha sp.]|uniref:hypothetical protein n=1 Tax=Treponema endosymbiont of Eucomonympha sp. TaxID=1580831 RepID=UPI001EE72EC7|nr:hypothetical protein [Treponema endosymbiont of Eucomonympha sp.]